MWHLYKSAYAVPKHHKKDIQFSDTEKKWLSFVHITKMLTWNIMVDGGWLASL